MGLCFLATLHASQRYWEASSLRARGLWLSLATFVCLLGMLSKEMMITVLAVVLLYERTFLTGSFTKAIRASWPLYVGLGCGAAALLATLACGPSTPGTGFGGEAPAFAWWGTQCEVFFLYAKLTFWPWPLAIHYELPYLDTIAKAWPSALPFALFVLASFALAWKRTAAGFVGLWILAVLSPTLIVPLPYEMAAERRMYVPLAAIAPFVVVSAYLVIRWAANKLSASGAALAGARIANCASVALVTVLAIVLTAVSVERITYYQDALTMFLDAIRVQPDNYVARANAGTILVERGQRTEALEQFDQAIRIKPESVGAHFARAKLLGELGRLPESLDEYREALRLDPTVVEAHYNYALALESAGQSADAIDQYLEIVELDPEYSAAHTNLAIAMARLGKMPEAIEHFERALAITPDVESYANLAAIYQHVGRRDEAIETLRKGIALARSEGKDALATELEERLQTYGP
jgi:tetratricopeptide (TPR) repeat protein